MSTLIVVLSLAVAVAQPQQAPHYVDGEHNAAFVEHRASLGAHSCAQLLELYGTSYGRRAAVIPTNHVELDRLAAALKSTLDSLQWPENGCSREQRILLYTPHECGLGAELHWLTVAMQVALVTRRQLVIREDVPWIYAEAPFCPPGEGSYSCYFRPLSACTVRSQAELFAVLGDDVRERSSAVAAMRRVPVIKSSDLAAHADVRVVQLTTNLNEQLDFKFTRNVPQEWESQLLPHHQVINTLFWWRSQLVGYIWRFTPRVDALLEERRRAALPAAALADDAVLIGMHSRSGDKVFGSGLQPAEMGEVDASWKFAMLEAVAKRCTADVGVERFTAAFVATKDPQTLQVLRDAVATSLVPLVWDDAIHRYGRGFSTEDLVKGTLNRTREALDALSDVDILSRCAGMFWFVLFCSEMHRTSCFGIILLSWQINVWQRFQICVFLWAV